MRSSWRGAPSKKKGSVTEKLDTNVTRIDTKGVKVVEKRREGRGRRGESEECVVSRRDRDVRGERHS